MNIKSIAGKYEEKEGENEKKIKLGQNLGLLSKNGRFTVRYFDD